VAIKGAVTSFATSPRSPSAPEHPVTALVSIVAGYTRPPPSLTDVECIVTGQLILQHIKDYRQWERCYGNLNNDGQVSTPKHWKKFKLLKKNDCLDEGKVFNFKVLQCVGILCYSLSKVNILEGSMVGKYLVTIWILTIYNWYIQIHMIIGCRATSIAFIHSKVILHYQIPYQCQNNNNQIKLWKEELSNQEME